MTELERTEQLQWPPKCKVHCCCCCCCCYCNNNNGISQRSHLLLAIGLLYCPSLLFINLVLLYDGSGTALNRSLLITRRNVRPRRRSPPFKNNQQPTQKQQHNSFYDKLKWISSCCAVAVVWLLSTGFHFDGHFFSSTINEHRPTK